MTYVTTIDKGKQELGPKPFISSLYPSKKIKFDIHSRFYDFAKTYI